MDVLGVIPPVELLLPFEGTGLCTLCFLGLDEDRGRSGEGAGAGLGSEPLDAHSRHCRRVVEDTHGVVVVIRELCAVDCWEIVTPWSVAADDAVETVVLSQVCPRPPASNP